MSLIGAGARDPTIFRTSCTDSNVLGEFRVSAQGVVINCEVDIVTPTPADVQAVLNSFPDALDQTAMSEGLVGLVTTANQCSDVDCSTVCDGACFDEDNSASIPVPGFFLAISFVLSSLL